jgi:molybdenum cofactor biosynthesis enzyme MoaA
LRNVRFSGGEPTLYKGLSDLVRQCKEGGVKRVAISSNGSRPFDVYDELIEAGVNDFSISLDACCASFGDKMAGVRGKFGSVTENIRKIAERTYVTVGVVLTEDNIDDLLDIVMFAHDMGVADIRIISAAQFNKLLSESVKIPQEVLNAHPILKYRVNHISGGVNVRGIQENNCHRCHLVKDDSVIVGNKNGEAWHFPCVIAMREGCAPIGKVGPNMRQERLDWFKSHNSFNDPICQKNCLDVCIDYNDRCEEYCNEED